MGDDTAREIERNLKLDQGWMDTPPTYAEVHGQQDPIGKAVTLLEAMEPEARYQALRCLMRLHNRLPPMALTGTEDNNQLTGSN